MRNRLNTLVIAIVCSVMQVACGFQDKIERSYSSYADLEKDDEPGNWVPKIVPSNFISLKEAHYNDLNQVWGVIIFDSNNDSWIKNNCQETNSKTIKLPIKPRSAINWWPNDLLDTNSNQGKYKYYLCGDKQLVGLATIKSENLTSGYFWIAQTWDEQGP